MQEIQRMRRNKKRREKRRKGDVRRGRPNKEWI